MSSEWPIWQIQDVCSVGDGAHSKVQRIGAGVPYLTSKNIGLGNLKLDKYDFISADSFNKLFPMESKATRRPKPGDLLIGIIGTFGNAYLYKESDSFGFSSSIGIIRPNKDKIVPRYLYYVVTSPKFKSVHIASDGGSAQGYTNIPAIKKLPIYVPPLQAQDAIASLLGALDDRIDLLRETNVTLEAIAHALFKSWFVDFEPVRAKMEGRVPEGLDEATAGLFPDGLEESELGAVPRGWQVLPVGDAVDTIGGATPDTKNANYWEPALHYWTTPKDLSGIASPVLLKTERRLSNEGLAKIGSGLLPVGTLLLSSRAPIGYLALAQVPMAINQGYIAMPPGGLLPPLYMLFWCQQNMETIKGRANGSTFMEISKRAFRPIPAIVPPQVLIEKFMDIAAALFERVIENTRQFETLATLRDTLLPRLISGQLRLSDVEAQIEAIAA